MRLSLPAAHILPVVSRLAGPKSDDLTLLTLPTARRRRFQAPDIGRVDLFPELRYQLPSVPFVPELYSCRLGAGAIISRRDDSNGFSSCGQ